MTAALTVVDGGPRITTSARAETLAMVEQCSASTACDLLRIVCEGQELGRFPARGAPADLTERILAIVRDDCAEREHGRHVYAIAGVRSDPQGDGAVEVFRTTIRVTGGRHADASERGMQQEASALGALKLTLRHQEGFASLLVRNAGAVQDSLLRELARANARIESLETQNDRLRAELRDALESGRLDAAKAEQERARTEMFVHAARQLMRYLPHVFRSMGWDLPDPEAAPDAPKKLAPPEMVQALASVTDGQLGQLRGVLTPPQIALVEKARAGTTIHLADIREIGELSDGAMELLPTVLRTDQLMKLVSALESVKLDTKPAGGG